MAPRDGNVRHPARWATHRRSIRYVAAALSAACAVVYFLIGFAVLFAAEAPADGPSMLFFGVPAGLAFALGAVLLLASDRRALWILGAVFQVFVLVAYVSVSEKRDPPYEMWGILLKVAQAAILVALIYLAVQPWAGEESEVGGDTLSLA